MQINITSARQGILSPTITVYLDGAESAWLGNGQSTVLSVKEGEHVLLFKAGLRSKTIKFKSSSDVNVALKWDRITGGLKALCTGVDVVAVQE